MYKAIICMGASALRQTATNAELQIEAQLDYNSS